MANESLQILMLSGRKSPLICGIGDYSTLLSRELKDLEIYVVHLGRQFEIAPPFLSRLLTRFLAGPLLIFLLLRQLIESKFKSKVGYSCTSVIHLQYEAFSMGQSYLLILFLMALPNPLVVTFHEVFQRNRLQKWRDRLLTIKARHIFVTDSGRRNSLLKLNPSAENKISILGVGSNIPRPQHKVEVKKNLLGYFGFVNAVKGTSSLLQTFEGVKKHIPSAKLRIIGDVDQSSELIVEMQEWIKAHQLLDSVEWTGPLAPEEVSRRISECHLMLLPFVDGASPRRGSLQACMALGKAVITTAPENFEPALEGLQTIPTLNPELWIPDCLNVLKNPDLCSRLERRSLEISENFTWSHLAKVHLLTYQSIAKS